ncbi:MAG: hypothetical protein RMK57_02075 [Bryobacterales bacterium]|nr:hypothetical protein [Bryobacteraceae bacterium]MDW8353292.1 hypothetical protein [Bryobacterales bacterium]
MLGGEGDTLDERLKRLMQELGNAINESLSESERIAEALGEIRRAGYEVFLVLEATIGFNKRDDAAEKMPEPRAGRRQAAHDHKVSSIQWTAQDEKFLRALKISLEDDPR